MTTSTKCFYPFTQQFSIAVGDMGSFIWSSYAGLWHIYNKSRDLANLSSSPDWKSIEHYLGKGIPDQRGFDLKKITSSTWNDHQINFSNLILTQGAILYEEWCQNLSTMISLITANKKLKITADTFQFPSDHNSTKFLNWSAIDSSSLAESNFIKSEIQPKLLKDYEKNINDIDSLLNWYRYFKSIRNSIVHNGGIIREEDIKCYNAAIKTPLSSIGIRRDYMGRPPMLKDKVQINLSDAVLLLAIIPRIAYGFDAKYCHTKHAEDDLKKRIRNALNNNQVPTNVTEHKKNSWIKHFLVNQAYILPANLKNTENWLREEGIVDIKVF